MPLVLPGGSLVTRFLVARPYINLLMASTVTSAMPNLPRFTDPEAYPNITWRGGTGRGRNYGSCTPVRISTITMPSMNVGAYFTYNIDTIGSDPITYTVTAGSLPTGLTLGGRTLYGTPTVGGAYSFTIQASNACGSDSVAYAGTVATGWSVAFMWLSTSSGATNGTVGVPYSESFATPTTNDFGTYQGDGTISWSVTGSLPPGLSVNYSTKVISGTPTTAGTYTIFIQGDNGSPITADNVLEYDIIIA